ncbi:hypothetical protein GCM10009865_47670 [Aeromicrobium ponti]|uniref:Phage minor structural protein n=1 Tax=Cytobacillus oceanisediminis TaxID=665099 RepID=A0A562JCZ4_9BACI|nr:phage tail spike protein [Cytobacillus oceanisediminis]TWH80990.1 phage minor structural protein [Cytobacillus oceanisediminis]
MIYVLNSQGYISDILDPQKERAYWNDLHVIDIKEGIETFDFDTDVDIPVNSTIVLRSPNNEFIPFIVQRVNKVSNYRLTNSYQCDAEFLNIRYSKIFDPQILEGQTPETALAFGLQGTRWEVGFIEDTKIRTINIDEHMNGLKFLRMIASDYEMELRFRVVIGGNRIAKRYVDFVKRNGLNAGKEIIFGKDLQNIERLEDASMVVTALYGIGAADENGNYLTIESVNNGKKYVEDLDALQRWGKDGEHRYDIYSPTVDSGKLTPQMLLDLTEEEFKKRINASVKYIVDADDLYELLGLGHERAQAGDTVRIKDEYFNPALYLEARILKTERSYTGSSKNKFTLGDYLELNINAYKYLRDVKKLLNKSKESWDFAKTTAESAQSTADTAQSTATSAQSTAETAQATAAGVKTLTDGWKVEGKTTIDGANIETGTVTWEKARGGTLALGGYNNENGVFQVYNSEGEVIADLDGSRGGFSELYVSNLKAPNVVTKTLADTTIYVSTWTVNTGYPPSDSNGGTSWSDALFSLGEAIRRIPKFIDHNVKIIVTYNSDLYETIELNGFSGGGKITIESSTTATPVYVHGNLIATSNSCQIEIKAHRFTSTADKIIDINACNYVYLYNCIFRGGGDITTYAIHAGNGSHVVSENNSFYDCKVAGQSFYGSHLHLMNSKGSTSVYFARAWGGVITGVGTIASAGSTALKTEQGGTITGLSSPTSDSGTTQEPIVQETTTTWTSTGGSNWSSAYGFQSGVRQGNYGYGRRTGFWFFGSTTSSTLTGKTIKDMKVYIKRSSSGGNSGDVNIYLRWHSHTSQPSTPSDTNLSDAYTTVKLSWGEGAWVQVPSTFYSYFQNGTAKGIGVYVASDSSSGYAVLDSTAKIKVTY